MGEEERKKGRQDARKPGRMEEGKTGGTVVSVRLSDHDVFQKISRLSGCCLRLCMTVSHSRELCFFWLYLRENFLSEVFNCCCLLATVFQKVTCSYDASV